MPNIKRGMMGAAGVSTSNPGPLFAWGQGRVGSYGAGWSGQNDAIARSSPIQVGTLETWVGVGGYGSNNGGAMFAFKDDGTMWSWGAQNSGQACQDHVINMSSPVQVGSLTNWSSASGDYYSSSFIKTDGTLWTCGQSGNGQGGQGDVISRSSPVQVGSLTDWSYSSTMGGCNRVIKTDGTLWWFGSNSHGMAGTGDVANQSSPVQIGGETDWTAISGDFGHSTGIRGGKLFGWGKNDKGQIADVCAVGDKVSSPIQIGSLTSWTHVSSGADATLAISDGKLYSFGYYYNGMLGQNNAINYSSPTQVGSLTDWTNIYQGANLVASIKANGTLWMWGKGEEGQTGFGATVNVSSPTQVGSETDWTKILAGRYVAMGIR